MPSSSSSSSRCNSTSSASLVAVLYLLRQWHNSYILRVLQMMPPMPMPVPAEMLPAEAMNLQDWLEQEPLEPAMIDDLEFAIALSLQEQVNASSQI